MPEMSSVGLAGADDVCAPQTSANSSAKETVSDFFMFLLTLDHDFGAEFRPFVHVPSGWLRHSSERISFEAGL